MQKFIKLAMIVAMFAACSKVVKKDDLSILGPEGEKAAYKVELAVTEAEMEKGLMNRTSLDANSGMIFDLRPYKDLKEPISMWMKDTKIPLDMVFIDKDGSIFWIYENAEPDSTQLIIPPFNPTAVLELNAGDVQKFNIRVGDVVRHAWFPADTQPTMQAEEASAVEAPAVEEAAKEEAPAPAAESAKEETPAPAAESAKEKAPAPAKK